MSRTEVEPLQNVFSRIHITIMNATTLITSPISHSKACDTFRPRIGHRAAIRAGLGGKTFVHFLVQRAMLNSLVREHCSEGRPAGIQNGFGHAGFGEAGCIYIADRDVIECINEFGRYLMVEIPPTIGSLRVDRFDAPILVRSLSHAERSFCLAVNALCADDFTSRKGRELFQPQVDADTDVSCALNRSTFNFDYNVQEPIPISVTRKAAAVFDLPVRKYSAIEDAECFSIKSEGIAIDFQSGPLNWNPAERMFTAAVSKIRSLTLGSGCGVLLADSVDGARAEAKFLATAGGEVVKVETAKPFAAKPQCVLLAIVAVIPNEIARPGLPV